MLENELRANPLVPRVISGKCFFAFQAVIHSNPKSSHFIDSNLTKREIAHLYGFHEGVMIRFELKHTKKSIIFFHFDFFNTMDTIQIWGTHLIERIALIQECFYKYNFAKVGAIVSTFLDELDGDVTLSTMVGGYYQKYVAIEKLELQHIADLAEAVSTSSKLHDIISVENSNSAFEEFRDIVDSTIKEAVHSLYGKFPKFTQPIITQSMLRTMENAFRRLLPV